MANVQPKKALVIVSHIVLQGNGILRAANCKLIICTLTELFVTSQPAMSCFKSWHICDDSDGDKL